MMARVHGWAAKSALFLLAGVASCRPHRSAIVEQNFPDAVTLYVAVSANVAKTDTGNVSAMVDALEADLRDAGSVVSIVGAQLDEKPPIPRIEIQVLDSDSGSAALRGAGNVAGLLSPVGVVAVAAGSGSMVADVYLVDRSNQSHVVGHFKASSFGAVTEVAIEAGDRMGHQIAARLIRH